MHALGWHINSNGITILAIALAPAPNEVTDSFKYWAGNPYTAQHMWLGNCKVYFLLLDFFHCLVAVQKLLYKYWFLLRWKWGETGPVSFQLEEKTAFSCRCVLLYRFFQHASPCWNTASLLLVNLCYTTPSDHSACVILASMNVNKSFHQCGFWSGILLLLLHTHFQRWCWLVGHGGWR